MAETEDKVSVLAKVMPAGRAEPQNLNLEVKLSSTVAELKAQIKETLESHPENDTQRVIFQGRQLTDDAVFRQVFQSNLDNGHPIALHVVLRPTQAPASTTTPARNFFSASSSSHSNPPTSGIPDRAPSSASRPGANIASPPPQQPAPTPVYTSRTSATTSRTTTPTGTIINYNRQTEITIRSERIIQTPDGNWQRQRREARQTLPRDGQTSEVTTTVETMPLEAGVGINSNGETVEVNPTTQPLAPSANITRTTVSSPAGTPNGTPSNGNISNRRLHRTIQTQTSTVRITSRTPSGSIPGLTSTPNNSSVYTTSNSIAPNLLNGFQTGLPREAPRGAIDQPMYWLLQGPNGPVSILAPPGAAVPTSSHGLGGIRSSLNPGISIPPGGLTLSEYSMLSSQDQEAVLRTQIENVRRSNIDRLALLEAERQAILRRMNTQPAQIQGVVEARVAPGGVLQVQFNPMHMLFDFILMMIGGGNPNAQPPTQETILAALREFSSVVWFAIKTIGVAWILSTSGRDVRRDTVVWGGAILILLVRIRVFETWLNIIQERINALIPDPNRAPAAPHFPQADPNAPAPEGPNPQEIAQRWIRQHNERQRGQVGGIFEAVQNGISLFMASLIPGLGERVGNARAAEMERERQALAAAQAAATGEAPPNTEENPVPAEGEAGGQDQAQAPGPQGDGIADAARDHFGEDRARELFGQQPGQQEQAVQGEDVQPMFGL